MSYSEYLAVLSRLDQQILSAEEVATILERARDYLLERGWCQGTTGVTDGPRCLVGAVSQVATDYVMARQGERNFGLICYPMEALRVGLGVRRPEQLPRWNDAPDRTLDDVVDLLERAAKGVRTLEIDYT
jgi:hypothetical protein